MMPQQDIALLIPFLIEEEDRLSAELSAARSEAGGGSSAVELEEVRARLRQVRQGLDECWDLLRLRRAAQVAGEVQGQA
ncbi:DUF2630 family protein [Arthrobacter sp. ISL-28]|uniref:DUF2630 family protein n=1 Tax=Arthrobacter sp. ISL-28 TaxID=2819108 RepID=UPI001BE6B45F|nr:DUF2630 family protein [Arthrobacter sp. ISL-28]MBT2523757.1 DUF2630 family protein [Arthrobacter sp. ISL-28]